MKPPTRPWWKKLRILLPLATLLLLVVAFAFAVARSTQSQIIIYNETGAPLGSFTVAACGQRATFARIADETSVRVRLAPSGGESTIELSQPASPLWRWEGGYLEPRGGYLVFIHIRPNREVELHTQTSLWQRVLSGRSAPEN